MPVFFDIDPFSMSRESLNLQRNCVVFRFEFESSERSLTLFIESLYFLCVKFDLDLNLELYNLYSLKRSAYSIVYYGHFKTCYYTFSAKTKRKNKKVW